MEHTLFIEKRYNGPPDSANGGYVAGLMTNFVDGDYEITLKAPPPLEKDLRLIIDKDNNLELRNEELIIATGVPVNFDIKYPFPVGFKNAIEPTKLSPLRKMNTNTCFGCGCRAGGLNLFSGIVKKHESDKMTITTVEITDEFSDKFVDDSGNITKEIIWTLLDCPGAHTSMLYDPDIIVLLGRMAVHIVKPIPVNQQYYVVAWQTGEIERRKHFTSTALYSVDDELYAYSKQIFIELLLP